MAKSKLLASLSIHTTPAYPVYIGQDLLSCVELMQRHIVAGQVFIVTNETIAPLYLEKVAAVFADKQCDVLILPDGEHHKNHASLIKVYDALMDAKHHRDTTLLALGGGVIGDLTGFAAATYQRGVAFLQVPTTLLAQVDASIGGKTAINHRHGKNMMGSFHQPQAIITDINTLTSLPLRELRAGFAEMIKYALLAGGHFLQSLQSFFLRAHSPQAEPEVFAELIAECCKIKAHYVETDEREQGVRALLNLGHSFAHALETMTKYQRWLHGEAVAIGLYCAALLSQELAYLNEGLLEMLEQLLQAAQLPCRIPNDIDLSELEEAMLNDKKIKDQRLRLILMRKAGDCFIDEQVSRQDLRRVLKKAQCD
jgi:3-dehydroquinate synthase